MLKFNSFYRYYKLVLFNGLSTFTLNCVIMCLFVKKEKHIIEHFLHHTYRPRGLMDKASDFESEDCEFESRRGRILVIKKPFPT